MNNFHKIEMKLHVRATIVTNLIDVKVLFWSWKALNFDV